MFTTGQNGLPINAITSGLMEAEESLSFFFFFRLLAESTETGQAVKIR